MGFKLVHFQLVWTFISVYSSLCFSILNLYLLFPLCWPVSMTISLSFTFSFIPPFLGFLQVLSSAFEHWHRRDESDSIWASIVRVTPLTPNSLILELNLARTCMCVLVRSGEAGLTSCTMALSMGFVLESQCLLCCNGKLSMHILKSLTFSFPICLLFPSDYPPFIMTPSVMGDDLCPFTLVDFTIN